MTLLIIGAPLAITRGLPVVAQEVANHIPITVENLIGEQTLEALDRTLLSPSTLTEDRKRQLQQRFVQFVANLNDGYRYRLEFRSSRIGPNAFALPGGTIVMTDALARLANKDEQLLAVIAHEIGHIRGRHGLRAALQGVGAAAFISALAGDATSLSTLAASLPVILTQNGYSREFETDADEYAFAHLKARHLSPKYFAEVMRLLQKADHGGDDGGYLSTHPASDERIRRAMESQ